MTFIIIPTIQNNATLIKLIHFCIKHIVNTIAIKIIDYISAYDEFSNSKLFLIVFISGRSQPSP